MNGPPFITRGFRFAFTVEARGEKWDTWKFEKDGQTGFVTFSKKPDGRWCIALFEAGEPQPDYVRLKLESHTESIKVMPHGVEECGCIEECPIHGGK